MGPALIVVVDGRVEQAAEMVLVEHDEVVEQLPPDGGDEALGDPVLPWQSSSHHGVRLDDG